MAKIVDEGALPNKTSVKQNSDGTTTTTIDGGSYRAVYGKDDEPAGDKQHVALAPMDKLPVADVSGNGAPLGGAKGGPRTLT